MAETVKEKEPKDWKESRKRRMLNTSASQHETFNQCPRKWWLSKVRKLPEPSTKSQVFGTVVHGVIERYLLADDLGRVVCPMCKGAATGNFEGSLSSTECTRCNMTGKVPVELYPPNWQEAKGRFGEPSEGRIEPIQESEVKRLIAAAIESGVLERLPGRSIEANFNRQVCKTPCLRCAGKGKCELPIFGPDKAGMLLECPDCKGDGHGCTIMMVGFIDVEFRDQVQDHKTTKSMKYAKSPKALTTNPQMLIYAHEIIEKARDRGEPLPPTITLRHNVYCAQENRVRKTEAIVTREHVENYWNTIKRNSIQMAELRTGIDVWHEIHEPVNPSQACNAYGGCHFRPICFGQETEEYFEKRLARHKDAKYSSEQSKVSVQGAAYKPITYEGTATMSKFDQVLAEKRAMQAALNGNAPALPPVSINPPPVTAPAITTIQAAPAAPVQTAAPVVTAPAAPPTTQTAPATPQPPVPPVEVPGVGIVQPPPWARKDCTACSGVGFSGHGKPCRICDLKNKPEGKPVSASYTVEACADGMVMWYTLPNDPNPNDGYSFITGRPATPVQTQAREALAPTGPVFAAAAAAPAPVVVPAVIQQHNAAPMIPATVATNLEVVGTVANLVIPAVVTAPAAPVQTAAPVVAAPVAPSIPGAVPLPAEAVAPAKTRTRRTRAQIEADNAKAGVVGMSAPQQIEADAAAMEAPARSNHLGMVLVIGCGLIKRGENFDAVTLDDVFEHFGGQLAEACGAKSYYELDPFKRRDELAKVAATIAEFIGDSFVICNAETPDTRALVEALRPHAMTVINALK